MLYTLANNSSVVKPGQQARGGGLIGTSSLTTRGGGLRFTQAGEWGVMACPSHGLLQSNSSSIVLLPRILVREGAQYVKGDLSLCPAIIRSCT
jgi:hypothetical protein